MKNKIIVFTCALMILLLSTVSSFAAEQFTVGDFIWRINDPSTQTAQYYTFDGNVLTINANYNRNYSPQFYIPQKSNFDNYSSDFGDTICVHFNKEFTNVLSTKYSLYSSTTKDRIFVHSDGTLEHEGPTTATYFSLRRLYNTDENITDIIFVYDVNSFYKYPAQDNYNYGSIYYHELSPLSTGDYFDFTKVAVYYGDPIVDFFEEEAEIASFSYNIPSNVPIRIPAGYACVAKLGDTDGSSYAQLESYATRRANLTYRDNRSYAILDNYAPMQYTFSSYSTQTGSIHSVPWNADGLDIVVKKGDYVSAEINLANKDGKYLYIYNPYNDYGTSSGTNSGQDVLLTLNCPSDFVKLIQNENTAAGGNDTVSFNDSSPTYDHVVFYDNEGNVSDNGWNYGVNQDMPNTVTPSGMATPVYNNVTEDNFLSGTDVNLYNPADISDDLQGGITKVFQAISDIFYGLPNEIVSILLAFLGILLTIGIIKAIL